MKELSLRPYPGRLFVVRSAKEFMRAHKKLFGHEFDGGVFLGHFVGQSDRKGNWMYLIYARSAPDMAHELSHVLLHLFAHIGAHPSEGSGEPFCYLLGTLMQDALA